MIVGLKFHYLAIFSRLLTTLFLCAVFFSSAASAQEYSSHLMTGVEKAPGESIEIYVERTSSGNSQFYIPGTANILVSILQHDGCEVLSYNRTEMVKAIKNNLPDLAIVNSDLASVMQKNLHYRHLLSFKNLVSSDAGKLSGSLVVVRKGSDFKDLESIAGLRIGRLDSSRMAGWMSAVGEVTARGYSAKDFFRRVQSYPNDDALIEALIKGDIAAAILQGCHYERFPESLRKELLPIEPRTFPESRCISTSELYPAWSIMAAPWLPEPLEERIIAKLKNERTTLDFGEWTDPSSLRDVHAMLKRSDSELIEEFEPESWSSILWKIRYPVLFVLAALLVLFIHDRLVVRAVNRQTTLVQDALKKQWAMERKVEAWERTRIVSIMSSMVAHEVKQPLTVIENYTQSLLSRQEKSGEPVPAETMKFALNKIEQSVHKAIEIIEHVRAYSKNRPLEFKPTDVSLLLQKILTDFRLKNPKVGVETSIQPGLIIAADNFELSVCFMNILKNAVQAMESLSAPEIKVSASLNEDGIVKVTVTDNGRGLSEQEIERLRYPLQTSKEEGLGLGLSIVKAIAERHRGSIRMVPAQPRGLSVIVLLGKPLEAAYQTKA